MVSVNFSANNSNTQIGNEIYNKRSERIISNNFKCNNKADNAIKLKKNIVLLGNRVKLWD